MKSLLKSIAKLDQFIGIFLNALLVLLVVDVSWQVFTRFVLPEPSSYTEEIARFLLIWIGLLGAAHAYRLKMHLGIDYFTQKMRPSAQRWLGLWVYFLCAVFAVTIMIIGGSNLALLALELNQVSASLGIKMGYIYLVFPLSGLLMLLYTFELIVEHALLTDSASDTLNQDFLR